ncbi:MAG TPA: GNAT family protein [Burkholderiaceae bacterium]|nr:GNAT family protein [Burkholderiaceae bacterium]
MTDGARPAPLPWPPQPVVLEGEHLRLEPLGPEHAEGLAGAIADGGLDELWFTIVPAPAALPGWIDAALAARAAGTALAFAVRRRRDGRIVGSTRYMNVEPVQRRLEIGTTFYAASVQRSALNTECKRLLLGHAFDALGCIAVEFRTHWFNQRSREAIARLGAKQDGVLRQHQRLPDGSLRDTVVFSIIDSEWPAVRRHLEFRQARLPAP